MCVQRVENCERTSLDIHPLTVLHEGGDVHMSSEDDKDKEYPCLVRVTDGKEAKYSTVVSTHVSPPSHRYPHTHSNTRFTLPIWRDSTRHTGTFSRHP